MRKYLLFKNRVIIRYHCMPFSLLLRVSSLLAFYLQYRLHFCVQVLSSHLMHSSLPGLTRLEQMFLVALADTVATTSAEVTSSADQQYTGQSVHLLVVIALVICTED